jgi:Family of unknown function (DUF5677)
VTSTVSRETTETVERFFTLLKSLKEFDRLEVGSVIGTQISRSDRENCFIATYRRCVGNVATLLTLKETKHFQAIAMLARACFELAVDIRLIDTLPDSCDRMIAFVDVERLRSAQKILEFKAKHPSSDTETAIYDSFVVNNKARIEGQISAIWNGKRVKHWSARNLADRVKLLDRPFEQIYQVHYATLSWYVHSGFTGIVNLNPESFTLMCGQSFKLAADAYWEVLLTVIDEFKIKKGNRKIHKLMRAAQLVPFTDTPQQVEILLRELLSD